MDKIKATNNFDLVCSKYEGFPSILTYLKANYL